MGRPAGTYRISNDNLLNALTQTGGVIADAAKLVGMTPRAIQYRTRVDPEFKHMLNVIRGKAAEPEYEDDF